MNTYQHCMERNDMNTTIQSPPKTLTRIYRHTTCDSYFVFVLSFIMHVAILTLLLPPLSAPPSVPTAACAKTLDAWCGQTNNTLGQMQMCLHTLEKRKSA
jgi:hypothetical protein